MLKVILLFVGCILVAQAGAAVYRCEEPDGSVRYSDIPCDGGKAIKLPKLQTYSPRVVPSTPPATAPRTLRETYEYSQLEIKSPAHESTVRQPAGLVTVEVVADPVLKTGEGHLMVLRIDGIETGVPAATTSFQLSNVDRGTHQLEAVIVGPDGAEIARTPAVSFHMRRFSSLHPQQKKLKQQQEQQEKLKQEN